MRKMLSGGGGEYFLSEVMNRWGWAGMEGEEYTVWLLLKSMGLYWSLIFFEKVMDHQDVRDHASVHEESCAILVYLALMVILPC